MYKLSLSLFRFDAKYDYLPYSSKYKISINKSERLEDLLYEIQKRDRNFSFPQKSNSAVNINGKNMYTKIKLEDIVENFGTELNISPISQKRAVKDLIIDDTDFYEKFDLIDPFVDATDRKRFEEFIIYHYTSDTYRYNNDYYGDGLFLFSYEMIEKYPSQKENILKVLADEENGIFLHTPLCNKIFPSDHTLENKIDKLKNEILRQKPFINDLAEKLNKEI